MFVLLRTRCGRRLRPAHCARSLVVPVTSPLHRSFILFHHVCCICSPPSRRRPPTRLQHPPTHHSLRLLWLPALLFPAFFEPLLNRPCCGRPGWGSIEREGWALQRRASSSDQLRCLGPSMAQRQALRTCHSIPLRRSRSLLKRWRRRIRLLQAPSPSP